MGAWIPLSPNVLTHLHFPEKKLGVPGGGRFAEGHTEGGLIFACLQREQSLSKRPGGRKRAAWLAPGLSPTCLLIAVVMAAALVSASSL